MFFCALLSFLDDVLILLFIRYIRKFHPHYVVVLHSISDLVEEDEAANLAFKFRFEKKKTLRMIHFDNIFDLLGRRLAKASLAQNRD